VLYFENKMIGTVPLPLHKGVIRQTIRAFTKKQNITQQIVPRRLSHFPLTPAKNMVQLISFSFQKPSRAVVSLIRPRPHPPMSRCYTHTQIPITMIRLLKTKSTECLFIADSNRRSPRLQTHPLNHFFETARSGWLTSRSGWLTSRSGWLTSRSGWLTSKCKVLKQLCSDIILRQVPYNKPELKACFGLYINLFCILYVVCKPIGLSYRIISYLHCSN